MHDDTTPHHVTKARDRGRAIDEQDRMWAKDEPTDVDPALLQPKDVNRDDWVDRQYTGGAAAHVGRNGHSHPDNDDTQYGASPIRSARYDQVHQQNEALAEGQRPAEPGTYGQERHAKDVTVKKDIIP